MEELDLTKADTRCGSDSPAIRLSRFWLEVGGNKEVRVIALRGVQEDQVNMWLMAMSEKGVRLINKKSENDKIIYTIFLP